MNDSYSIPVVSNHISSTLSTIAVPLPPPGFDEDESLLRAASSPGSSSSPLHTPTSSSGNGYHIVPDRRYNLPNKAIALKLVGKGGSTKNNIRDTTGVRIKIDANAIPPYMILGGTAEQVRRAREEIHALGIHLDE
jgi:hypothetical protein